MLKTRSINKILRYQKIANEYNKSRLKYAGKFTGFRKSIENDKDTSRGLVADILQEMSSLQHQYFLILRLQDKIKIILFERYLKRDHDKIRFDKVCIYLADLSGFLDSREEI